MNEQNRQRLARIAKRHANRTAQRGDVADEEFLAEFARVRDEVLRPMMEEIGAQLRADGYDFRVDHGGSKRSPAVGLHVVIPGRDGSKDTIQFFAHEDVRRGWQVIAELELARSPTELARFDAGDPITRDVAEHLIVDATEQMFASALATSGPEAREKGSAAVPAPAAPPLAANAETVEEHANAPDEGAEGARSLVLAGLRAGRVLHGLDLVGADLHGLDFTGALMPGLNLRGANLRGCALTGANLVAAQLQGTDLTEAILTGANLSRANLTGAVLVRARLDCAVLVDTVGVPVEAPEEAVLERPACAGEDAPGSIDLVPLLAEGRAPALSPLTNAPESRWALWTGKQELAETEEVNIAAFRTVPLPFTEGAPTPSFFAAADASRAAPRIPRRGGGNETTELPVIRLPEPEGGRDPVLTVEQYAAFCAELTVFPEKAADTHRKYRVASADARAALDAAFAQQFRADPSLQRRWRALVDHYGAWYRREAPR